MVLRHAQNSGQWAVCILMTGTYTRICVTMTYVRRCDTVNHFYEWEVLAMQHVKTENFQTSEG
eukprot:m.732513 g.732513  ORF g.732513 m.732513 type:complete len:63 (-) comp23068_c0_seq6:1944-2132(-)